MDWSKLSRDARSRVSRLDWSSFSHEDWVLAGLALLLVIDLLFVPWFDYNFGFGPFTRTVSLTGTDTPDGWLGVLAVLAALAVIADLAIERLGTVELPAIAASRAATRLTLVGAAALFLALKFIMHAHFGLFGFGFWAAFVLTVALIAMAMHALEGEVAPSTGRASVPGRASAASPRDEPDQ